MNALTMKLERLGWGRILLVAWALGTFLVSLLPEGVGGAPRLVDVVLFLCLGPACALVVLLMRSMPPSVAGVVALGSSLAILVLSSQVLVLLGVWGFSSVTGIVCLVTVVLVVVAGRDGPPHQ